MTQGDLDEGVFYPEVDELRAVSEEVARAVVLAAISEGVAGNDAQRLDEDAPVPRIAAEMWSPEYLPYRYVPDQ